MMAGSLNVPRFGPIMQLGFVTADFEAALEFWTKKMGVGPFFRLDHVQFSGCRYRENACRVDISTAFAYWGDVQIELIHQHNETPSVFKAWIDSGAVGVHHVCVLTDDLKEARAGCAAAGGTVVQEAWMDGAGRFIYVDFGAAQGLVEFAELAPAFNQLFSSMRRAAEGWDGADPVRSIPTPEQLV